MRPLGRRTPPDFNHVEKYPYKAVAPLTVSVVNKTLKLPYWHWTHAQGQEGSCVGHATAMERAIANTAQNIFLNKLSPFTRRYDPIWQWNQAKIVDPWPDTNPGDDNGTDVDSAYKVARDTGARRIKTSGIRIGIDGTPVVTDFTYAPDKAEGVVMTRWATTVDEMRTAISAGNAITIGIDWYSGMDNYMEKSDGTYIYATGSIRGGHALCVYGASDRRQAFRIKNSWGRDFPLVWLPYTDMQKLLRSQGEAALVTDR